MKKIFWVMLVLAVLGLFLAGCASEKGERQGEGPEEAGKEPGEGAEEAAEGLEFYKLEQIKAMSSQQVLEIAFKTSQTLRKQQEEAAGYWGWKNCAPEYKKLYVESNEYKEVKGWAAKTILGKEMEMCLTRRGWEGEEAYIDLWALGWTWSKVEYKEGFNPIQKKYYILDLFVPTGKDEEGAPMCSLCRATGEGVLGPADMVELKCGEAELGAFGEEIPC